jgi:hypothetical protein
MSRGGWFCLVVLVGFLACRAFADSFSPVPVQAANTTTAADGTYSVTWASAFSTPQPFAHAHYIGAPGSQPVTCQTTTSTATVTTGKCYAGQATLLSLSIVTTGLTLAPFVAAAGGITVQVLGRDTTQ